MSYRAFLKKEGVGKLEVFNFSEDENEKFKNFLSKNPELSVVFVGTIAEDEGNK